VKCRLTTLSENTAAGRPRGLLAEWGLSLFFNTTGSVVTL
jgi:hypothetical protein